MGTTMNISLSEDLKDYVSERVKSESFSNASDYIRSLIREDQRRRGIDRLEQDLLEGLDTGGEQELDAAAWRSIRAEARARQRKSTRRPI